MNISLLAVISIIVAAVVRMILGMLWYSLFFGKAWMKTMGMDPNNPPSGGSSAGMLLSGLASLIIAIGLFLALQVEIAGIRITTLGAALLMSLVLSILFNLSTILTHAPFEGHGFTNALIGYGYDLTSYLSMVCTIFFFVG